MNEKCNKGEPKRIRLCIEDIVVLKDIEMGEQSAWKQ